ncbi:MULTISPECIES: fumarylacetoacetase [unclassified Leptolyngbya]|uniref:fumarylacetoacetase n=1 Tax=unclassified Leptolyngbya TaxID=2650499 RepID=UPI001683BCA4|nr:MULTISPECIES: fumarylacetoacetase [unclassified Leptolyngbya]MBD1913860.1 fumarylacetoacetase [Leptolyngbya sp. FACHB-8]MBD2157370.1 fumarylacetoacetase [Leptolyngbya sp. FACHB-16]
MHYSINETHNPNLKSWVESANTPDTDFPIQNLPFGLFQPLGSTASPRIGVAIGNYILDLSQCSQLGLFQELPEAVQMACTAPTLNPLMAQGQKATSALRTCLSRLLQADEPSSPPNPSLLISMAEAELLVPAHIGDYTDFYASIFHATNVGKLFRPDNPLLPNYKYVPIAYHGRASSIRPSGTSIQRPKGQRKAPDETAPNFGPCRLLDYELEVGWFIGAANELGRAIAIDQAEEHIFGLCLVNDWSARDIQAWEYQPLGPFLAKNFATTLSPWVVTLDALAPFRCAAFQRPESDPQPLPYLTLSSDAQTSGIDITVEAWLQSAQMREQSIEPIRLSQTSFQYMYWTLAQMVTHHTSNGCNLQPGDLMASGTVSGPEAGSLGSLIEITQRGAQPISLPTGEERSFLQDGDEVILRGFCQKQGYARVGFGECRGIVQPSIDEV